MWDTGASGAAAWTFVEFPGFSEARDEYFESDGLFADFQWDLARNPEHGAVMPSCGGLRKVRWADTRRGKGKRGGLRVVYLAIPEIRVIVLVDVYGKGEADDLTAREKRLAAQLARETKKALLQRHRKGNGVR